MAHTAFTFLAYLALFAAVCVAVQIYTFAYAGDLSRTGDEAAHFVNSAMMQDYALHALGTNPVRFALEYYGHLPRVSIGHWPPFFYVVQAGVFLLTGVSFTAALGFQTLAAGSTAALTATIVSLRTGERRRGGIIGVAAGFAVLASPDLLRNVSTVMVDTFLTVLVLLTLLAWVAYARTVRTTWSVAFALCASAAILTKGNAFGLGLLPVLYVALSGQFALVANWRTWLAAVIVLLLTTPWYALTYKISSDGFVYSWGMDYTARALPAYTRAALDTVGPVALASFAIGTITFAWRAWHGDRDEVVLACASAAIGMFLFLLVAPADIQSRYLIAIVPPIMISTALSLVALTENLRSSRSTWRLPVTVVVVCFMGNGALTFRVPHPSPNVMNEAARAIIAEPEAAPLVLAAAGPNGEGALIAAFAAFSPEGAGYIIRASKAFAKSSFMGSNYQARFGSAEEVGRWIVEHRIGWLVLDEGPDSMAMLHNRQVAALADAGQPSWHLMFERTQGQRTVRVFRLDGPPATSAEIAAVLRQVAPEKVSDGGAG